MWTINYYSCSALQRGKWTNRKLEIRDGGIETWNAYLSYILDGNVTAMAIIMLSRSSHPTKLLAMPDTKPRGKLWCSRLYIVAIFYTSWDISSSSIEVAILDLKLPVASGSFITSSIAMTNIENGDSPCNFICISSTSRDLLGVWFYHPRLRWMVVSCRLKAMRRNAALVKRW